MWDDIQTPILVRNDVFFTKKRQVVVLRKCVSNCTVQSTLKRWFIELFSFNFRMIHPYDGNLKIFLNKNGIPANWFYWRRRAFFVDLMSKFNMSLGQKRKKNTTNNLMHYASNCAKEWRWIEKKTKQNGWRRKE